VWEVLGGYRRYLQTRGLMDPSDTIREARLLLEAGKLPQRYAAIVADEVQDFSESELRLLRAMVPEGPNDLFLVGDAHQRIYGHKASLSRCGINVRGLRSRRLRLNYRTTQNIRNFGVAVLRGMSVDDLDEGTDDALKGYHSLRTGEPPKVVHHATEKAEADFIVQQLLTWTGQQARQPSGICVTARTHDQLEKRYAPLLRDAGFSVQFIKADESGLDDGIRLATMHRVKGLEFPCVLIAGVHAGSVPLELDSYEDETARKEHIDTERRLLFVAATRARDELVVTGFGTRSAILGA
jgi:superfamily I DNA/RNA helicase